MTSWRTRSSEFCPALKSELWRFEPRLYLDSEAPRLEVLSGLPGQQQAHLFVHQQRGWIRHRWLVHLRHHAVPRCIGAPCLLWPRHIKSPVITINVGLAASMASFLLAAGEKGKRIALPHSRTMIHQAMGGAQGQAEDIKVELLAPLPVLL